MTVCLFMLIKWTIAVTTVCVFVSYLKKTESELKLYVAVKNVCAKRSKLHKNCMLSQFSREAKCCVIICCLMYIKNCSIRLYKYCQGLIFCAYILGYQKSLPEHSEICA